MIEILVTLVIISLALLGSAGLQAYALKTNQGGQFRNQAAFYVADIVERMEANKAQAIVAGGYTLAANAAIPTAPSTACETAACSAANMAVYDLTNWQYGLSTGLPSGRGVITQTATTASTASYTISVSWVDRKTNTNYATNSVTEPFSITTSKTIRN